ncbi:MAG: hypothetical protein JWO45_249 [Spartobacteria bacterium]|nr:hypothetical protein [Spartobacteria bacterium]
MALIDRNGGVMRNALVIVCGDVSFDPQPPQGHIYVHHPAVAVGVSQNLRECVLFAAVLSKVFDYKLFHKRRPYMEGF